MSTQINQYFMYGIQMPYSWRSEWEEKTGKDFFDTFEDFMDDNAFDNVAKHKEGIFCLSDGRDGKYIVIGRVLKKTDNDNPFLGKSNPLTIPHLTDLEKELIAVSIERNFGLKYDLNFHFITHFR